MKVGVNYHSVNPANEYVVLRFQPISRPGGVNTHQPPESQHGGQGSIDGFGTIGLRPQTGYEQYKSLHDPKKTLYGR